MITAILIDDEKPALLELKFFLDAYPEISILGMYKNPLEAITVISHQKPDVVFLDINMPKLKGTDAALKILDASPKTDIVFVTAYDEYAVEAFELYALDFILKPIQIGRFNKTMRRILEKNSQTTNKNKQNNNALNIKYLPESVTEASEYYIQIFGELSITINGNQLSINWRSAKVKELFEFYIHNRYTKIHRHKILDELWGDMEYERALTNFNTCNYQLRKQFKDIGLDIYPTFSKGYYQLIIGNATYDAEVFDEILSSIKEVNEENLELISKTLTLYKGGYCENADGLWAVSRRYNFENLFINTAFLVAEYYFRNNMYSNCVNYLQKIIEINQLFEKAWLLLLKALKMSGDAIAYRKVYENMQTIFLKELGTIPSFNC